KNLLKPSLDADVACSWRVTVLLPRNSSTVALSRWNHRRSQDSSHRLVRGSGSQIKNVDLAADHPAPKYFTSPTAQKERKESSSMSKESRGAGLHEPSGLNMAHTAKVKSCGSFRGSANYK
ncbi:hypothetical protein AAVH_36228, partial [Aphelenchoides avenae]